MSVGVGSDHAVSTSHCPWSLCCFFWGGNCGQGLGVASGCLACVGLASELLACGVVPCGTHPGLITLWWACLS